MKRRKTAKGRLRQALERAQAPSLLRLLPKSDFSDPQVREKIANHALQLTDRPQDALLKTAFEKFDLDPANPFAWADLLRCLCEIVFVEGRKPRHRGAPPKWDEHRRQLFQTHVAIARRNLKAITDERGLPPPTNDLIADYLQYKWPKYYHSIYAPTLRQYIVAGPPKGRKK